MTSGERRAIMNRHADVLRAQARRATKAKNRRKWNRHADQLRRVARVQSARAES